MKSPSIPVLFRKFPDGDIIAWFPTIPGTYDHSTCMTYAHIGQHGAGTAYDLHSFTKPATEPEYRGLLHELTELVGYKGLKVVKRISYQMHEARRKELRAMINA